MGISPTSGAAAVGADSSCPPPIYRPPRGIAGVICSSQLSASRDYLLICYIPLSAPAMGDGKPIGRLIGPYGFAVHLRLVAYLLFHTPATTLQFVNTKQ